MHIMNAVRVVSVFLLLSTLSAFWLTPKCSAISGEEAKVYIDQVAGNLASVYSAVAGAETAGANVTGLREKLKTAGGLLAEANDSLRIGDYESAYSLALQCNETVNGVIENAASLRTQAETAHQNGLFWTGAGSSFGLSVLFVLGLFSWRFLKRRFLKQVLELKPELGGS